MFWVQAYVLSLFVCHMYLCIENISHKHKWFDNILLIHQLFILLITYSEGEVTLGRLLGSLGSLLSKLNWFHALDEQDHELLMILSTLLKKLPWASSSQKCGYVLDGKLCDDYVGDNCTHQHLIITFNASCKDCSPACLLWTERSISYKSCWLSREKASPDEFICGALMGMLILFTIKWELGLVVQTETQCFSVIALVGV